MITPEHPAPDLRQAAVQAREALEQASWNLDTDRATVPIVNIVDSALASLDAVLSAPPAQEQAGQMAADVREFLEEVASRRNVRLYADDLADKASALLSASPVQQEGAAPNGEAFPGAAVPPEQYAQNLLESCANWLDTRAQVPQMVAGETGLMGIYAADLRRIKAYIAATPARADAPIGAPEGYKLVEVRKENGK
jgi:hypothetical protein